MHDVIDLKQAQQLRPEPHRVARIVIELNLDTGERSSQLFGVKPAHTPDLCLEMQYLQDRFEPYMSEQADEELPQASHHKLQL